MKETLRVIGRIISTIGLLIVFVIFGIGYLLVRLMVYISDKILSLTINHV